MWPSINDVMNFLRFLTPPSPLSPVLLNRIVEFCQLLADPPLPKWMMSFMDGPLRRRCRPGKKVIRKDVTRPFSVWTSSAADVVSRGRRPKRFKKAGSVFSSLFFFSKCWYHQTFFQQVITVCWLRYKECNFNGKLGTKKQSTYFFRRELNYGPKGPVWYRGGEKSKQISISIFVQIIFLAYYLN